MTLNEWVIKYYSEDNPSKMELFHFLIKFWPILGTAWNRHEPTLIAPLGQKTIQEDSILLNMRRQAQPTRHFSLKG
jgi:hypothetical protein